MPQALVGRQPIYKPNLEVFGYELLFRRADEEHAVFNDGDAATSQVILNTFHEIGMREVVGRRRAFINVTRGFIVGEYPLPVPVEDVVLEVLEHVEPDAEVMKGLERLHEQGFTIALDDFEVGPRTAPMLQFADMVKVDYDALDEREVRRIVDIARNKEIGCVAEQVRTLDDYEECLELGFDLFQGYFLSRPKVISGRRTPTSRMGILRLLARMMDPECELDELEDLIAQDVTLTYRLLRHINAAHYGMPRRIDSVRETVVYLGRETIRNLAGLFVLSGVDDRPHDLVLSAMLRGRMCELLANAAGVENPGTYFAVGMLSILDALLECPMEDVVSEVHLSEALEAALLAREGELGEALTCVIAYERGDWERVSFGNLESSTIKGAFLGAVQWAEVVDGEIQSSAA